MLGSCPIDSVTWISFNPCFGFKIGLFFMRVFHPWCLLIDSRLWVLSCCIGGLGFHYLVIFYCNIMCMNATFQNHHLGFDVHRLMSLWICMKWFSQPSPRVRCPLALRLFGLYLAVLLCIVLYFLLQFWKRRTSGNKIGFSLSKCRLCNNAIVLLVYS